jgi:phosphatidylserine/phosphatidylglycerophosphate/cardiolipin synthase-like enzyme
MTFSIRRSSIFICLALLALGVQPARAQDRLCDPGEESCRSILVNYIRNETVGIDVGFWFMEDPRYATELIAKHRAGVPVRVVFDSDSYLVYGYANARRPVELMRDAGVPMRDKKGSAIFHFKMMLFAGQNQVEFSGANYSPEAFVPGVPYSNYVDEVINFIDDPSIVDSFKTRFDDVWTDNVTFVNFTPGMAAPVRHYPTYPIDPDMNFVPWENFRTRSVAAYKLEQTAIDAIMYRITDRKHSDAMISAVARNVPVRLITEPMQYRDNTRLWHAWNVDRMYMAGVQVRHRKHAGISHEKLTILQGQGLTIAGSSNWTSASADSQHEHNIFTTREWMLSWAREHFNRKWNNTGAAVESEPFVPLPPGTPVPKLPANLATEQPLSVTLAWYAGPWAHKYDVFFGTSPSALVKIVADRELGPSESATDLVKWTVNSLSPGTTYYWKVVGRTMANLSRTSTTFRFRTAGETSPPPPAPPAAASLPDGWSSGDIGAVAAAGNAGYADGKFTIAGSGSDVWGTSDELRFAYRTLTGDGTIVAEVASVDNLDSWTKAGVMIRDTLSASSAHALMLVSPGKGVAFQRRVAAGGLSTHTGGGTGIAPVWLRLTRTGDVITAYRSADGSTWALVGSDTIAMAVTVQIGLAVSSHRDGTLATASFQNVTVSQ